MRIRITHETVYSYSEPAKSAIQLLRLTPRGHEGQTVLSWTIDMEGDARLMRQEDWYGNIIHSLSVSGPVSQITLKVAGEIETTDTAGVIQGGVERFPEVFYLRETPLSRADPTIREFAETMAGHLSSPLEQSHALMAGIQERLQFDTDATSATTIASDAFSAGHGVCQDFTHIFLAAARHLKIPARYVSGYLHPSSTAEPGQVVAGQSHAWVEAWVGDWMPFDPTNGSPVGERHVVVGRARDYADLPPLNGIFHGGPAKALGVSVELTRLA